MIRMQKLEALMEAVEGAYFVQSDQVASGQAGWAEQRGDCFARPRGRTTTWVVCNGWHVAAGCNSAVDQRLNTEFLISTAEFIDISTARVRIFWPFLQMGQIISWNFLPAEYLFIFCRQQMSVWYLRFMIAIEHNEKMSNAKVPPVFIFDVCLWELEVCCEMAYSAQSINPKSWQMWNMLSFFLYPFLLCCFLCLLHLYVACFLRLVEVMAPF